jgi:hypothetical protein
MGRYKCRKVETSQFVWLAIWNAVVLQELHVEPQVVGGNLVQSKEGNGGKQVRIHYGLKIMLRLEAHRPSRISGLISKYTASISMTHRVSGSSLIALREGSL